MTNARLTGLDQLRGIAAICVVLTHLVHFQPGLVRFGNAYLAVDFFFVLSGYVMARAFEPAMRDGMERKGMGRKGMGPGRFLAMRYVRLWPPLVIGGVIALAAMLAKPTLPDFAGWLFFANLLLLPVVSLSDRAYPLNPPAWSIFFELLANILHAALLHRLSTRAVLVIAIVAGLAFSAAQMEVGVNPGGGKPANFLAGFPRVLFAYCLGVVLYRAWRDRPPVNVPPLLAMAFMPVSFALAMWLGHASIVYNFLFVAVACPLIVAGGLRHEAGLIGVWLGRISFPLYATHFPVMRLVVWSGGGLALAVVAALVVAFAVALAEPKIQRALRRPRRVAAEPVLPA